jgi:hypothetical protein
VFCNHGREGAPLYYFAEQQLPDSLFVSYPIEQYYLRWIECEMNMRFCYRLDFVVWNAG